MSSSYVEVREAENGTEENALPIAIDTCESNGIVPVSQIDGEPQKDHTYNKEPLEVQGEVEVLVSSEEVEDTEVSIMSPEKTKRAKKQRSSPSKKSNKLARSPVKKESSKKSPSNQKKKVAVKEKDKSKASKKEEESVSDSEEKLDGTLSDKDSSPTKKRSQKRKAEATKTTEVEPKAKKEKVDVKKNKTVKSKGVKKEDQEQTGNDIGKTDEEKTDVKESEEKSPSKLAKRNLKAPSKTPKKNASGDASSQGDSDLPEGWTRKVVQRKSGKTAGQFDVYIYSPDGKKLRSRPDIAAYLAKTNSPLTIDDFNFSLRPASGSQSPPPVRKSTSTVAKTKSSPKGTSVTGKKKNAANNSKKAVRLVVKLNFSPKKRILSNYEEQEKTEKLGDVEKSEGGKKATPKKSPARKQKSQPKKKTPTKQTPSKK